MKVHSVLVTMAILVVGGLLAYVTPPSVSAEVSAAQVSPIELTLKAGHLPVQTANAI